MVSFLNSLSFFRFIKGYVTFEVDKKDINKLLNQAYLSKLLVWDVIEENEKVRGKISNKEFERLLEIAEKTKITVIPIKLTGINKFFNLYKNRKGLIVGVVFFVAFLLLSTSIIWEIDVEGNKTLSDSEIISLVEDGGIRLWKNCHNVDTKKLADEIASNVKEIDWIGINLIGSKAIIKVKEIDEEPKVSTKEPCNVVANKDGVIVSVETYDGRAEVKKGDVVKKGDILISGIISDDRNHTYLRNAKSKVIARTFENKRFEKELKVKQYVPTNESIVNKYFLFFGKEIPFLTNKKFTGKGFCSETKEDLKIGKINLPFFIKVKKYSPFELQELSLSPEKAKQLIEMDMEKFEYEKQKFSKIVKKEAKAEMSNNKLVCIVDYVFEENIAKIQKILEK